MLVMLKLGGVDAGKNGGQDASCRSASIPTLKVTPCWTYHARGRMCRRRRKPSGLVRDHGRVHDYRPHVPLALHTMFSFLSPAVAALKEKPYLQYVTVRRFLGSGRRVRSSQNHWGAGEAGQRARRGHRNGDCGALIRQDCRRDSRRCGREVPAVLPTPRAKP